MRAWADAGEEPDEKTPADAPEIELDEDFWRNVKIVETAAPRSSCSTSGSMDVDPPRGGLEGDVASARRRPKLDCAASAARRG
jgi:hypothetical protein